MTKVLSLFPNVYRTPEETVLQHRQTFYLIRKERTETIAEWFFRIRSAIGRCDYGDLGDFLFIDKFFCGLDSDVRRWPNDRWFSPEQLFQAIIDPKFLVDDTKIMVEHKSQDQSEAELQTDAFEASFCNTKIDSSDESDFEKSNKMPDFEECDVTKVVDPSDYSPIETRNGRARSQNVISKPKTKKSENDFGIKSSKIDGEKLYSCLDCGKTFKQKATFRQHRKLHTDNLFHCHICNKQFLKRSRLINHFRKHEREQSVAGKSFECHLCKFQFLRVQGLRMHINIKHLVNIKNNYQCEHCASVLSQQTALDEHLRLEHKLVCGVSFKTRKQLNLHMARHTNERRFKCAECGQMLKSRSNYKTHMRKHTGERPFSCNRCDKSFVQRANYLKHTRWHSGERPHACTFCTKRFPTNYDMKLHVNSIHTGEKPFACEICDRKFSQPSTLRVHRLRVHR